MDDSGIVKVLAAVDFCDHSPLTLEVAHALARGSRGSVIAIHVIPPPLSREDSDSPDAVARLEAYAEGVYRERMNALLERAGLTGKVEGLLRFGDPVPVIRDEAWRLGVDLIVVGNHDRAPLARLVVGSVGREVSRTSPCPVITVRRGDPQEVARRAPGRKPSRPKCRGPELTDRG